MNSWKFTSDSAGQGQHEVGHGRLHRRVLSGMGFTHSQKPAQSCSTYLWVKCRFVTRSRNPASDPLVHLTSSLRILTRAVFIRRGQVRRVAAAENLTRSIRRIPQFTGWNQGFRCSDANIDHSQRLPFFNW